MLPLKIFKNALNNMKEFLHINNQVIIIQKIIKKHPIHYNKTNK